MHSIFKARVVRNSSLNPNYSILSLAQDIISFPCAPGQFFMLQTGIGTEPLLKRPFSIFSHKNEVLHFLYRITGTGTLRLSQRREGDIIEVIGPLGRPYPKPEGPFFAIAGGSGIASIHCLLEDNSGMGQLLYGARDNRELVLLDSLQSVSKAVVYATDNGSVGIKGTVIDALESSYKGPMPIYACGPKPMLKALSLWANERGVPCYVSLEEHMACGIGACLSCVAQTQEGLKSICKEGPVFKASEVIWD